MSKNKAEPYSSEFKQSAVKLAIETDQPISQTARELGVNPNTVHTWISKYSKPQEGKGQRSEEHVYEEIKRLRRENARLKEERDILTKAAAYFAKETR